MLGVLVKIFDSNSIVGDCGFPREGNVSLEYLMRGAADLDVRAVAVEGLPSLRRTLRLLDWAVAVKAAGRTLV
jgi:hypothetical protein